MVAHYQSGYQRRLAGLGHCRKNTLAHPLTPALHRVSQRGLQTLRRRLTRPGAHIAGGLHALLPEPQFVVKALKIKTAVRGFDAHRHTPTLARHHGLGLSVQVPIAQVCRCAARCHAPVPAQVYARRQAYRLAVQRGRFQFQAKTQTHGVAVRHLAHHAYHLHIAPFQGWV